MNTQRLPTTPSLPHDPETWSRADRLFYLKMFWAEDERDINRNTVSYGVLPARVSMGTGSWPERVLVAFLAGFTPMQIVAMMRRPLSRVHAAINQEISAKRIPRGRVDHG